MKYSILLLFLLSSCQSQPKKLEYADKFAWVTKNKTCNCKNLFRNSSKNIKFKYDFNPTPEWINNKKYFKITFDFEIPNQRFSAYIRIEGDIMYWLDAYAYHNQEEYTWLSWHDKIIKEQTFLNFTENINAWNLYTFTESIGLSEISLRKIEELENEKLFTFELQEAKNSNGRSSDYKLIKEICISNKKGIISVKAYASHGFTRKCQCK